MERYFDIIKAARALFQQTAPRAVVSEDTAKDYKRKVDMLAKRGDGHPDGKYAGAVAEALKTTKVSTWNARRAAIQYDLREWLSKTLTAQDKLQRTRELKSGELEIWQRAIERIGRNAAILQALLAATLPAAERVARKSKRTDMRGLPRDWRDQLIARMPEYRVEVRVAAITGCRPNELVKGIVMEVQNGVLIARVAGAKVDDRSGKGQAWRQMEWTISDHPDGPVAEIAEFVTGQGRATTIRVKNANSFSKAITHAGERTWPKRKAAITAYCLRHQLAADMKADGMLDGGEISAALGHRSDLTKSTYGHSLMARGRRLGPSKVSAASPVRTREPKPFAKKTSAKQRTKLGKAAFAGGAN